MAIKILANTINLASETNVWKAQQVRVSNDTTRRTIVIANTASPKGAGLHGDYPGGTVSYRMQPNSTAIIRKSPLDTIRAIPASNTVFAESVSGAKPGTKQTVLMWVTRRVRGPGSVSRRFHNTLYKNNADNSRGDWFDVRNRPGPDLVFGTADDTAIGQINQTNPEYGAIRAPGGAWSDRIWIDYGNGVLAPFFALGPWGSSPAPIMGIDNTGGVGIPPTMNGVRTDNRPYYYERFGWEYVEIDN